MNVALLISVISLVLSVSAVSLSLYILWGRSRVTAPPLLSTKSKEPEEAELAAGLAEWPTWSSQDALAAWRRPAESDWSLPGDPKFNVTVKSG